MDYTTYKVLVYTSGTREWYLNDKLHREDGPAIELANGTKAWCLNGDLHREDGPAIEYPGGTKEWWLNDVKVTESDVMKPTKELTIAEIKSY